MSGVTSSGGAVMINFAYKLAKELGVWDVAGMLEAMTWRQFVGWMRYADTEPFGEERADLRSAIVASLIANANRNPKKRPRPFSVADFMPFSKASRHVSATSRGAYEPVTDKGRFRRMTSVMRAAFGPPKRSRDKRGATG